MDVCPLHGIWLDQGELEQIEAWFEAQERHLERDRATWGGTTGKLEQIEEQAERQRAEDVESIHWGPVGWFAGRMSWWHDRRDD
jgi:Zn-finger nucleic acid-binding protein